MSNYATKNKSGHATGIDTYDLAAQKDFIDFKAEVDKLDVSKLVTVTTSVNNLKTKVDGLDVGKFKIVPVDLRRSSDVVNNEAVKNTKCSTL